MPTAYVADWCKGSITDSLSVDLGSTPKSATIVKVLPIHADYKIKKLVAPRAHPQGYKKGVLVCSHRQEVQVIALSRQRHQFKSGWEYQ